MEDYLAYYGNVGQLLVQMTPLLVPSGSFCADMAENDAVASLAERTVGTLCAFTLNGHLLKIRDKNLQNSFLQQLAACLGIEYLPVAVLTLPAWRRIVQGHERQVNDHREGQRHLPSRIFVVGLPYPAPLESNNSGDNLQELACSVRFFFSYL
jgi:hypothetical protein